MLRTARRRRVGCAVAAALLAVAVPSCGTPVRPPQYALLPGVHLTVVGDWSGTEQAHFRAVLRDFRVRTGARVTYVSADHGVASLLDARLAADNPPDVALLPQPGLLRHYANSGRLVPLDDETIRVVRQDYAPIWRSLASSGGKLYGVWFKAANKSLLWYDVGAFERAGIAPPEDLQGLLPTAQVLRARGTAPFSLGAADQWTLTDWFENVYLQQSGPRAYDRLAAHRMSWTDPTVIRALTLLGRLWAPNFLLGGPAGAQRATFEQSVERAFAGRTRAAMVMEGDFVAGVLTDRTHQLIGTDVDAVPFPAEHPGVPAIVGGGDVAVQMRRSPGAAELVRFLASPEAAAVWARAGGFLSANLELDLSVYPDALTRSIARSLVESGNGFRFDLSDQQPAAFGATQNAGMFLALSRFLRTRDVWDTARQLERLASAAYARGSR
jgi:ABC-type glycerol-3-phosphate transport system substrate-binding protein